MSPVRHENATTVGGLLPLYKIRVQHSPSFLLSTVEMVRPPSGVGASSWRQAYLDQGIVYFQN